MRIHTRVILDWEGNVLHDEFYEYEGPVAHCGGGDVNIPEPAGPSAQELELMEKQTDLLEQQTSILNSQIQTQSLLAPFVYEQLGLKPTYAEGSEDPNYKVNQLTTQREQLQQQLSQTPRYQGTEKVWVPGKQYYSGTSESGMMMQGQGHYEERNLESPAWTNLNSQLQQLETQITDARDEAKSYTGPQITGFEEVSKISAERRSTTSKSIEEGLAAGKSLADIQRDADINEEDLNDYISTQLAERELKAFTGNLPVDPALQYEFENQQLQMEETMRKRLGPDWRTTTPGMQAMDIFSRRKTDIIGAQQRGELQLAEALTQSREGSQLNTMSTTFGNMLGTAGYPYTTGAAFAQNAAGYSNPLGLLQQDRWNRNNYNQQTAMFNAKSSQASMGNLFGGIGSMVGTGAGLIFSDRRLKKNVRKIGFHVLPIYEYNYVWEEDDAPLHTGPMANELEKVMPSMVVTIAGYKAIRYGR